MPTMTADAAAVSTVQFEGHRRGPTGDAYRMLGTECSVRFGFPAQLPDDRAG